MISAGRRFLVRLRTCRRTSGTFTALTQLIPGITPNPAASTFEGGQVAANGTPSQQNVYLLDGMYNNDDRLGGSQGTQVRVVLDNIEEYQVLTNQYSAEYGGDAPYNPTDPTKRPFQLSVTVGPPTDWGYEVFSRDRRGYFFVEDRWRMSNTFTLNLGLRYDHQSQTPNSKDDFGPRVGFALQPEATVRH